MSQADVIIAATAVRRGLVLLTHNMGETLALASPPAIPLWSRHPMFEAAARVLSGMPVQVLAFGYLQLFQQDPRICNSLLYIKAGKLGIRATA